MKELKKPPFKPTLIFFPATLTPLVITKINKIYSNHLFAGIVGGIGDRSIYIFGYHVMQFLYLDPHTVQPAAGSFSKIDRTTYQPINMKREINKFAIHATNPSELDKFCTIGFLVRSLHEVDEFHRLVVEVFDINENRLEAKGSIDDFEVLDF